MAIERPGVVIGMAVAGLDIQEPGGAAAALREGGEGDRRAVGGFALGREAAVAAEVDVAGSVSRSAPAPDLDQAFGGFGPGGARETEGRERQDGETAHERLRCVG